MLPGAGQLYAGYRRWGLVMVGVSVFVTSGVLLLAPEGGRALLGWLITPRVLIGLLVANLVLLAWRIFATVDAYRRARRRSGRRYGLGAEAMMWLLVVAIAAPHLAAGYLSVTTYDLVTSVFDGQEPADDPVAAPNEATTTTTLPWDGERNLNVLILGVDVGADRMGVRTDTIIVASISPRTRWTLLFGLPRNLVGVPLPPGPAAEEFPCRCWPEPLNALYAYGRQHPELFPGPDPGMEALKGAVGQLLGLRLDFYTLIDFHGFVELIDALGGVEMVVGERVHDPTYPSEDGGHEVIDILPGTHHLDGHLALAYVRARRTSSDYDRMARQRCLIGAIAEQLDLTRLVRSFGRLASIVEQEVETDIPLEHVPALVSLAPSPRGDRTFVLGLTPPVYVEEFDDEGFPIPNRSLIRRTVSTALAHPVDLLIQEESGAATVALGCR